MDGDDIVAEGLCVSEFEVACPRGLPVRPEFAC